MKCNEVKHSKTKYACIWNSVHFCLLSQYIFVTLNPAYTLSTWNWKSANQYFSLDYTITGFPKDWDLEIYLSVYKAITWSYLILAATAAAKSLQSCPTLCNPLDGVKVGIFIYILKVKKLEAWEATWPRLWPRKGHIWNRTQVFWSLVQPPSYSVVLRSSLGFTDVLPWCAYEKHVQDKEILPQTMT